MGSASTPLPASLSKLSSVLTEGEIILSDSPKYASESLTWYVIFSALKIDEKVVVVLRPFARRPPKEQNLPQMGITQSTV